MTRTVLSGLILSLLIAASAFIGVRADRGCGRLIGRADRIWELYTSGDTEAARREAELMEKEWEDFRKKAAVMLEAGKLSEIDRECSRIVYLVEADAEELHSELTELKHMAESLRSGEKPFPSNIF